MWYLDIMYLENMLRMFTKVSAKEQIVGFYSTGPRIRVNDANIDLLFRKYVETPVMVIVDVRPEAEGMPIKAYFTEAAQGATALTYARTFLHLEAEIEAYEAEEVGVEHLLRDINDPTIGTLSSKVQQKMLGLRGLKIKLEQMWEYLKDVQGMYCVC